MTQSELTTSHLLGTAHGERGRLEKCDLQHNRLHYTKCMHVHVLAITPRQLPTFNLCCRQGSASPCSPSRGVQPTSRIMRDNLEEEVDCISPSVIN